MKDITYKEELAKFYNNFHKQEPNLFELQLQKIINILDFNKNDIYYDLGCGSGRLLTPLNDRGYNIKGIEKSYNMYNENIKYNNKIENIAIDENIKINSNKCYFSMSLHQMGNKLVQKKILDALLKQVDEILLITISSKQMDKLLLNKLFPTLNKYDRNRFLFIEELDYKINYYEEQFNTFNINRNYYIDLIKNKYISSLQILDEVELNKGLDQLSKMDIDLLYLDAYTYIKISK
jgi:SAM-dependent methyltransferase